MCHRLTDVCNASNRWLSSFQAIRAALPSARTAVPPIFGTARTKWEWRGTEIRRSAIFAGFSALGRENFGIFGTVARGSEKFESVPKFDCGCALGIQP
jgi:hypothetical protein